MTSTTLLQHVIAMAKESMAAEMAAAVRVIPEEYYTGDHLMLSVTLEHGVQRVR